MKYQAIIQDLKAKKYAPFYLLSGEEPFYIDKISDFISSNVLDESEKAFNQMILYGRDSDLIQILETAKNYPMMASHQVIIVKEAQELFKGKISEEKKNALELYFEKPTPTTILVFCHKYKNFDSRKKFVKVAQKNGVVFTSKKLYDDKIPKWISDYIQVHNYKIGQKACAMLTEFLGNDLSKITNELEKLMLILEEGSEITPLSIEENIGISKDFNVFEFLKSVGSKDVAKANQIVNYFANNSKNHPLVVTIVTLYSFFSKLLIIQFSKNKDPKNLASIARINPYFINDYLRASKQYSASKIVDIIRLLRIYDLKSKGVGNDYTKDGELLKELTYQILH